MEMHPVTEELLAVVQDLPPERQEHLLELARVLAKPGPSPAAPEAPPVTEGPLVERHGFLLVSAQLEGPLVDHREVREEYLARVMEPAE
ncbi:MAG: hypothetical protein GY856_51200 [bacterium]|nr:hypothetical protein [bacterium]